MPVRFLTLEQELELHRVSIERYGGSLGVRDTGLLESALAAPQSSFGGEYLHPTLAEMAAAYLFHVVKNHPFVDGNKRTGLMAANVFLATNRVDFQVDEMVFADLVLAVAAGEIDKKAVAEFFRQQIG